MSQGLSHVIPDDWHHWSKARPTVLQALAGGLTNRAFLIESAHQPMVLRINSSISNQLNLDRAAERQALQAATTSCSCAPLIYCDPAHHYLVTRFIQGTPWDKNVAQSLETVADLLYRIHNSPAIEAPLDIVGKIASYRKFIDKRAGFYSLLDELQERLLPVIDTAYQLGDGDYLCHNDLTSGNLIWAPSGRLYAIDWEYAAMGDKFYDLAVLVEEHGLDQGEQNTLLGYYLGRTVTPEDNQRLHIWRLIYSHLYILWYAVQWSNQETRPQEQGNHIAKKAQQLLGNLSRLKLK
ncbi:choline kinase family protein [Microbulbifer sp. OS29]|uniref:Choline kinase family protein n=1 Tax=Microbulbifer okhotskensis TaxID=2926617 RepID=A0A9X2EMB9_9GAMM|nr:choline kinase family protein [Microbulbifer okhotskensis]MCO1334225.1 choline kinase family protein [Microbulbifer okhotskensis]